MKKKIVNVLLLSTVLTTMLFSAVACGAKDDEMDDAEENTFISDEEESSTWDEDDESTDSDEEELTTEDGNDGNDGDGGLPEDGNAAMPDGEDDDLSDDEDTTDEEDLLTSDDDAVVIADMGDPIVDEGEEDDKDNIPTEENKVADKGKITLEQWIKSDECAEFSAMMNEGLDGMTISFEVNGNTISMIFTLTESVDVAEGANDAMNEYFESNAVIFEAIRDQLVSETGNRDVVLKLVYRNADNSEIYSKEF